MAQYNTETAIVWNTYQLYRWDMLPNLQQAYFDAQIKGYKLGAKLVRGAYMEKEAKRAKELKYPNPIQPSKAQCDKDFDAAILFCLDHYHDIHFCVGTHNEASSLLLAKELDSRGLPHDLPSIWFAQLLGMSDNLSFNLAKAGYNVAKYVPYGPVKAVMPYLTRRAQENTSIAGQTSRELQLVIKEMRRRGM
jgi:proline dehydrogenase